MEVYHVHDVYNYYYSLVSTIFCVSIESHDQNILLSPIFYYSFVIQFNQLIITKVSLLYMYIAVDGGKTLVLMGEAPLIYLSRMHMKCRGYNIIIAFDLGHKTGFLNMKFWIQHAI